MAGHLEHVEDLILTHGKHGFHQAIDHLVGVANRLTQGDSHVEITQKWDGRLAIFFGWDHADGKFFVSTKSIFSKIPLLLKTPEDCNNYPITSIREHLVTALKYLRLITPKDNRVWQADLMYIRPMLHMVGEDVTFRGNTITYSIPRHSTLGEVIWGSEIGVIIHTVYHDLHSLKSPIHNPSLKGFGIHHYVWWAPATIAHPKHQSLSDMELEAVRAYLAIAQKTEKRLTTAFYSLIAVKQVQDAILRSMNVLVRKGTDIRFDHTDLSMKLLKAMQARLAKSPLGMKRVAKLSSDHAEEFLALASILSDLTSAKLILVRALERNEHEIKSIGTGPEGFVAIKQGSVVKLVDRLGFSRLNFERHS